MRLSLPTFPPYHERFGVLQEVLGTAEGFWGQPRGVLGLVFWDAAENPLRGGQGHGGSSGSGKVNPSRAAPQNQNNQRELFLPFPFPRLTINPPSPPGPDNASNFPRRPGNAISRRRGALQVPSLPAFDSFFFFSLIFFFSRPFFFIIFDFFFPPFRFETGNAPGATNNAQCSKIIF